MVMTEPRDRPRRRLRWLLPAVLTVIWLVFAGGAGNYGGKLGEVVKNDNAAFLPSSADATKVAKLEPNFYGAEQIPAVVVYARDTGVSPSDQAAIAEDVRYFQSVNGVAGPAVGPIPAQDGKALQVVVPLTTTGNATLLPGAVEEIRKRAQSHEGMTANVTGPGGMSADFSVVFGGVDVTLLLVTLGVVFLILIVVYRSLILPLLVLTSALFTQALAALVVYFLAHDDIIKLNGQSQGTLIIICIGAATDYALLLVGRYREELRDRESKYEAMGVALRRTVPTILASGFTVIIAMMCLLLADLSSNRGYGPVFAIGIGAALVATLTFLSSLLVLFGRAAFWPVRPTFGSEHRLEHGIWARAARLVSRRPRLVWTATAVLLLALIAALPTFKVSSVSASDSFLTKPDSVTGLDVLAKHFPAGSGSPALIVAPVATEQAVAAAAKRVTGVADVTPFSADPPGATAKPKVVDGQVLLQATLTDPADSSAAQKTVDRLRDAVRTADPSALVGGTSAIAVDTARAGWADLKKIVPIVLLVVLILLIVLLRAVVGPLLLILTVVLSVAATFGVSALVFNHVFHFPGADPSLPLFCVVFLIALGVDYNIFLMARVREESQRQHDTRQGVVRGLTTTGGVITSAGVVLAATFSVLGIIPLLALAQIAFIVVAGILIDTFVVRALLAPALSYNVGDRFWWPWRPTKSEVTVRRVETPAKTGLG
jgi:RND superfamily putative drug exporter